MEFHLAPLENVSCWAFRSLCKGATDSYTGMLSLSNLVKRNNAWKEVDTFSIPEQRQWIQIATSKEIECSAFIKRLQEELKNNPNKNNVYGIQLNASCPSPQLIKIGQGPALIKRANKVTNLILELLKQDKFRVSIKVRLGLNQFEFEQRKIFALFESLKKINNPNFTGVTVHFKHAQQKSSEPYNYSILKDLLRYDVPIIINGGIKTANDFIELTKNVPRNNISGFMVGRAAMQDPDALLKIKGDLCKAQSINRPAGDIKKEFDSLCKIHPPNQIYLETIKEYCIWAKD